MDCSHVHQQHLADRYVLGQLTAAEAERFEDHYLSCDECSEELERARLMTGGFKRVAAEEVAATLVTGVAWWRRRRIWMPLATAAVAVVLSVPFALDPSTSEGTRGGRVNTPVVYLQPVRDLEPAPSHLIRLPEKPGWIVLVLELDPPFYPVYRARVERGGRLLWEGEGLRLGERDTVTLSLESDLLAPGDHALRLDATTGDGRDVSVGRFAFRVLSSG